MFISVIDLFKIGIGPSSSHTMGPMIAAHKFSESISSFLTKQHHSANHHTWRLVCILKGSLAYTGKGHATDIAVTLGLNGFSPVQLADKHVNTLTKKLWSKKSITINNDHGKYYFDFQRYIGFSFNCCSSFTKI